MLSNRSDLETILRVPTLTVTFMLASVHPRGTVLWAPLVLSSYFRSYF